MAQFIALFHAPYFLKANLAATAPRVDLKLWQDMQAYAFIDPSVALQVQQSLLRHQWYLSQELVILALFDNEISDEQKGKIASALLQEIKPATFNPGNPKFTDVLQNNYINIELYMFVGPRSWLAFELSGFDHDWLQLHPSLWASDRAFLDMACIMTDLAVVNDTAERGIKDVEEYANASQDGEQRGKIILVSNSHRAKLPAFLKSEMEHHI